jgi:hypothetical protein
MLSTDSVAGLGQLAMFFHVSQIGSFLHHKSRSISSLSFSSLCCPSSELVSFDIKV